MDGKIPSTSISNLSTVQCLDECMHAFFRNSRELFCPAKLCLYEGDPDASDPSLLKGLYIADLLQFETK